MVILTGANSLYFLGLANLVGSIHFWAPDHDVIVYDLGLTKPFAAEVRRWRKTTLVSDFAPEHAPAHWRTPRLYAWKPLAIHHALLRHPSVLWIDAGSDLRAPVAEIQAYLEQDGHLFVQGQDLDMTLMSHDITYAALGTQKARFIGKQHFAGNLQGYTQNGQARMLILEPFYQCALNRDCIAPAGSDLSNHRFDQTVLSILIYQSGLPVIPRTQLLAAHRDALNSDPKQPSSAAVYTARCRSREYIGQVRHETMKQSRLRLKWWILSGKIRNMIRRSPRCQGRTRTDWRAA